MKRILGKGLEATDLAKLGGKARSLHELGTTTRVRVPGWFVVSSDVFASAVAAAGIREPLAALLDDLAGRGADRDAVASCRRAVEPLLDRLELDADTRRELAAAYQALGGGPVAVRSSALDEDGASASFAGCLDTFLFVEGESDITRAVVDCWRSAYSERSLAYRAARGRLGGTHEIGVAVVVQRMIDGEVSGVLFTADPSTGERDVSTITAAWGLGEGVVAGTVDCDTFRVRRDGVIVERDAVSKLRRITRGATGRGTVAADVAASLRDRPCLEEAMLAELVRTGGEIETAYGVPMDIEWTSNAEGLWILQARPITTGATGARADRGERLRSRLWDNSNIVESFDGVTTPFTYSHARRAYTMVYQQTFALLGTPAATLAERRPVFEQFVGMLNGRIYYNLESWYRALQLLPGYQFNAEFMEQMMGVSERASFGNDDGPARTPSLAERYLVSLPRLIGSVVDLSRRFAGAERLIAEFFDHFDREIAHLEEIPLATQSLDALVEIYLESERRITSKWTAPIVNDLLAMIFFGTLRKLVVGWKLGEGSVTNDLLCGEGGLISAEPTRELLRLVEDLRRAPEEIELLRGHDAETVRHRVETEPRFGWWKVRIQQHVDRFGDRCIDELKLEEPTLRDDPTFLYRTLKAYAAGSPLTVDELEAREAGIRRAAEATVGAHLTPARRRVFDWVLSRARRHIKHRENLRFCRTRAFGFIRRLALAMGDRLVEAGQLDRVDDVFYLELDELIHFTRGTSTTRDLRGLVRLRRDEFARYRAAGPLPERFGTQGAVGLSAELRTPAAGAPTTAASSESEHQLQGTAASPGVVRAPARLVRDPRNVELHGHVLVANRTDPGWVPLFPSAAAVVVERGSVLSHSAIVAREFGIPCVVGLRDALARIPDGAWIEVDGGRGTVTRIEAPRDAVAPVSQAALRR